MAAYQLSWQVSKDPKDKTGSLLILRSPNDLDAILHANELMVERGFTAGSVFHIHLKQCNGRTVSYNRGF